MTPVSRYCALHQRLAHIDGDKGIVRIAKSFVHEAMDSDMEMFMFFRDKKNVLSYI